MGRRLTAMKRKESRTQRTPPGTPHDSGGVRANRRRRRTLDSNPLELDRGGGARRRLTSASQRALAFAPRAARGGRYLSLRQLPGSESANFRRKALGVGAAGCQSSSWKKNRLAQFSRRGRTTVVSRRFSSAARRATCFPGGGRLGLRRRRTGHALSAPAVVPLTRRRGSRSQFRHATPRDQSSAFAPAVLPPMRRREAGPNFRRDRPRPGARRSGGALEALQGTQAAGAVRRAQFVSPTPTASHGLESGRAPTKAADPRDMAWTPPKRKAGSGESATNPPPRRQFHVKHKEPTFL
jgi:hypothetical protein